jgi:hypothetical protein
MPDATMMFHLIMIIAVISAFGGLWFGLSNRRSDVPVEVKYTLAWGGLLAACVAALVIAFNQQLTPIGYEVGGLVLCLSLLLGFLGVGLSIGPARGE